MPADRGLPGRPPFSVGTRVERRSNVIRSVTSESTPAYSRSMVSSARRPGGSTMAMAPMASDRGRRRRRSWPRSPRGRRRRLHRHDGPGRGRRDVDRAVALTTRGSRGRPPPGIEGVDERPVDGSCDGRRVSGPTAFALATVGCRCATRAVVRDDCVREHLPRPRGRFPIDGAAARGSRERAITIENMNEFWY